MAKMTRSAFFAGILRQIPPGFIPLEAVTVVKCLDPNGEVCLFSHKTLNLAPWEAYGMLSYACEEFTAGAYYGGSE